MRAKGRLVLKKKPRKPLSKEQKRNRAIENAQAKLSKGGKDGKSIWTNMRAA